MDRVPEGFVITLSEIRDNEDVSHSQAHRYVVRIFEKIIAPLKEHGDLCTNDQLIIGIAAVAEAYNPDEMSLILGSVVSSTGARVLSDYYHSNEIH